jgi:hypothetical protein
MIGRHKGIRVGGLRHKISVQINAVSNGASSQGQPIPGAKTFRFTSEPADYEYASGGVTARGRQVDETVRAVFTVRYRDGYTIRDSVVFRSQEFGIVHIRPVMGRDRYLELHCRSIES